jgi:hypothetical protein
MVVTCCDDIADMVSQQLVHVPVTRLEVWPDFTGCRTRVRGRFPFIEPENKEEPGFWLELYNFSILLWIPAIAVIGLAGLLQFRLWVIKWTKRR